MSFLDAISEKTLRSTVALTAARGRGKSASIGICLAGAIAYGYSNIFVTAPSPENLKSVFEFLIIGLKALKYVEHMDFETLQEHRGDAGKVVIRLNIFKNHRQTVQYILPDDHSKLAQAELIAIDEAAAIPLPVVRKLLGPYLVFMSSTVNGYEGTGRALSLKLIQQLRKQQGQAMANAAQSAASAVVGSKGKKGSRKVHEDRWKTAAEAAANFTTSGASSGARTLTEITLETPIRYGKNDKVEKWLNNLLCLDVIQNSNKIVSGIPSPRDCELYLVNRDALFSYHAMAEGLLQRIWSLYTSAHYKNTPNDLQMLSDAPAHRLFVLLGPRKSNAGAASLPDVLCVIQVAFEGRISQKSVHSQMSRGNKASGDMIPWVLSQQFNDNEFATLSGARIVRVATHPDVQKMGYGSKAIELLISHFQGEFQTEVLDVGVYGDEGSVVDTDSKADSDDADLQNEEISQKATLPPLLVPVSELPTEQLDWLGVSYGLTPELLNFWSRHMFKMCYIRQSTNDLTGEHSVIMIRQLQVIGGQKAASDRVDESWLQGYVHDYRRRIISLLSYNFATLPSSVAVTLIDPDKVLTSAHQSVESDEQKAASTVAISSDQCRAYNSPALSASELVSVHLTHHDLKRLELYSRNMVDHHMIIDTLPTLSALFFQGRFPPSCRLSHLQVAILLSMGLQRKSVDDIAVELNLPVNQVLAFFNKTVRKLSLALTSLLEQDEESKLKTSSKMVSQMESRASAMSATSQTLQDDQNNDVKAFNLKQKQELLMQNKDIAKHALKGVAEGELELALAKSMKQGHAIPSSISVLKVQEDGDEGVTPSEDKKKKRKKDKGGGHEKKHKKNRV
jgi:N-acetyltransferase 10